MKISRDWLQNYTDGSLPDAPAVGEALTFHAFEIESVENEILDVKVTANRGHDCLSHRGIAKELSAILKLPMNKKWDPFLRPLDASKKTDAVTVSIEDTNLCKRYIAGYMRGVKVGPSPDWLRKQLEAIGQRSINNVVDATNLVMFNIGQPLHAFDAEKLTEKNGSYAIWIRAAKKGETMLALDDKEYALSPSTLVIVDGNADTVIGIAGVKGGKPAGVTERTTDIILEAANFDGVSTRKTSQALKLRTDASERFQQVISPELAGFGMQQAIDLIKTVGGGELAGIVDEYPSPHIQESISVSLEKINAVLGTTLQKKDVADVFERLGFEQSENGGIFTVQPPFERLDLLIAEDLIEEVARIIGYDMVPMTPLESLASKPAINENFAGAEKIRTELTEEGYSEVFTSIFSDKGERAVANKVDSVRPYLRTNLIDGLKDAYEKNVRNKDLLGLSEIKIFEIGSVWKKGKEDTVLGVADKKGVTEKKIESVSTDTYGDLPVSKQNITKHFQNYPFIVRDIAMWVPSSASADEILKVIRSHSGELLVRSEQFDEFKRATRHRLRFALFSSHSTRRSPMKMPTSA
jgi:phenylalanyl-tRNA synthetase beta chain